MVIAHQDRAENSPTDHGIIERPVMLRLLDLELSCHALEIVCSQFRMR